MGKFSKAFEQGQVAAESAAQANAEIDEVFREMANDLCQTTDGKLVVTIETSDKFRSLVMTTISLMSGNPSTEPSKDFWICAKNPTAADSKPVRLAGFQRPYEGYPCSIEYGNSEVRCNDAVALTAALNTMLQNAWVASELRKIVDRQPIDESNAKADGSGQ